MPPIKSRMQGRMGPPTESSKGEQLPRRTRIQKDKPSVRPSPLRNSPMMEHVGKDDNLKRLRVPSKLLHSLPSVKKYQDSQDFVDLTDLGSDMGDSVSSLGDDSSVFGTSSGSKRSRMLVGKTKYQLAEVAEERFLGIIWDVGISPVSGEILVACSDGLFLCHNDLSQQKKLEEVILPGGVAFREDGSILALCRNTDTMHVFSPDGSHERSFQCGKSPMTVAVVSQDEMAISDPCEKCLRLYDINSGENTNVIKRESKGCSFSWPLYLNVSRKGNILVVDAHSARLMEFTRDGRHVRDFQLKTSATNEVLRPHGLALHPTNEDIFVVDTALETLEVFSPNDQYIQTIIGMVDGQQLKPKCVRISNNGEHLVVGGRSGKVRLYQFWEEKPTVTNADVKPLATEIKAEPSTTSNLKKEILDTDEVIVLD